jgi:ATP-dependent DNA helicase RecQ
MIDKTLESARLDSADREAARAQKFTALGDMHSLAQTEAACFRQTLLGHFEGNVPSRTSLGKRLLSWVFSEGSRTLKQRYCCDVCASLGSSETRPLWAQRVLGE